MFVTAAVVVIGMSGSPVGAAPASLNVTPAVDAASEDRILALNPEQISAAEVRDVLSRATAPRIINLQGSLAWITMQPFAEYLVAMGVPEERLRNPANGTLSYSSFADSERLAGTLAWYYENEGMMPMLIGHSQGGMLAIRCCMSWSALSRIDRRAEPRHRRIRSPHSITDPSDGRVRPVSASKYPLRPRSLRANCRVCCWDSGRCSANCGDSDSVEEFTGFTILWDPIAGTFPEASPTMRPVPPRCAMWIAGGHESYRTADAKELATHANTRMDRPVSTGRTDAAGRGGRRPGNLVVAADIWYSVKKHWCLEAQRVIRQRRVVAAGNPPR
jgi:hypothetical protein